MGSLVLLFFLSFFPPPHHYRRRPDMLDAPVSRAVGEGFQGKESYASLRFYKFILLYKINL